MTAEFDVAVIGAGIVGLAVARELRMRHPGFSVIVLEREHGVGRHQTSHNSGVIHSGVYYKPGSLKAKLCVEGSRLMYEFCDEHDIPYERCGKLIVALTPDELPRLDEIEARGRANGVRGLRRVDAEGIRKIEPEARGISGLHSPDTGIVDYGAVAEALESELRAEGVEFCFDARVDAITDDGDVTRVTWRGGEVTAKLVISCAGLWSDRLAVAAGASPDPRIVPFRGAYLTITPTETPYLTGLVYPVPDPDLPFLGVHVTKHIGGAMTIGPTALLVGARDAYRITRVRLRDLASIGFWPGTWRMARKYWRTALEELAMAIGSRRMVAAAARYVPKVAELGVTGESHGGVRAQAMSRDGSLLDDFVISETAGAVHVRNAPSPAATSSLALARELVDRIEKAPAWTRTQR